MNLGPVTIGYTIHNKYHLLPELVNGILRCFNEDDEYIFVLDDCTDATFEEYERIIGRLGKPRILVPLEELFEVKANNRILRTATKDVIILFQDDMVCQDVELKKELGRIIQYYGDSLGLVGGRDGFEFKDLSFPERPVSVVSSWIHKECANRVRLSPGEWAEKTILNRGPIVFTRHLLEKVGYLDEDYYPLWGDDMDYCCRAKFKHGLTNVVFHADIKSPLSWGTTRKGTKLKMKPIMQRNWGLFVSRWGSRLLGL